MPAAASKTVELVAAVGMGWRFQSWASSRLVAGVTDRRTDPAHVIQRVGLGVSVARAEQVHGASIAAIERRQSADLLIPGCDGLLTHRANLLLFIRTADCLPILYADPRRGVVGIAHAGWRGIAANLPARMLAIFSSVYGSAAEEIRVTIGPAIHACCYEVGPEFEARFGAFVTLRDGRRTCDLIGAAIDQLQRAGVALSHILDSGHCTGCELRDWYSLRKEGSSTGRMTSFIMVRSS